MSKICSKCNFEKELKEFYKDKNARGGRRSSCKGCDVKRRIKFAKENPKMTSKAKKRFYNKNIDKIKKYSDQLRKAGYFAQKQREFYSRNRGKMIAQAADRRAQLIKAKLGNIYDTEISEIYKSCPKEYEVHHIIPLRDHSNIVCGLHVPWNLEILTKEEHLIKHEELRKKYG